MRAALVVCVWVFVCATSASAGTDAYRPYDANSVKRAFAASGIQLCTIVVCSGLPGKNGERSWEANFSDGGTTYNIYVALERTPGAAATQLDQDGSLFEYQGNSIGRVGNVWIAVGRYHPLAAHRVGEPMSLGLRIALARLAGRAGGAVPDRLCESLARHPLSGAKSAWAPTCAGLPVGADTEYRFDVSVPEKGGASASLAYRIYPSATAAARAWPRDRGPSVVADALGAYGLELRSAGHVAGVDVPSSVWASSAKLPRYLYPGLTVASVRVGRVSATVEVQAAGKTSDVPAAEALAARVAARLAAAERS